MSKYMFHTLYISVYVKIYVSYIVYFYLKLSTNVSTAYMYNSDKKSIHDLNMIKNALYISHILRFLFLNVAFIKIHVHTLYIYIFL